jgi:hypothetical protein
MAWLKWPTAFLALAFLPGALLASIELLVQASLDPAITRFLMGFALYSVVWWWFFRRSRFAFILTLEHELTHALFAMLTFHRVTGLRVTAFRGGHMRFVGEGNWLITVAPYFFPTLSMFLLVVAWVIPAPLAGVVNFLVGGSFAYHMTSTLRETHPGQTDLQQTGMVFCLCFLPAANIVTFGAVLGFVYDGWPGATKFVGTIWQRTLDIVT